MQVLLDNHISYQKPDIPCLEESGYQPVDMHLHTRHSDGLTRIPDLLTYAQKNHIGIAITDHNEISGVVEAFSYRNETLIIPGIELETREGPHLLFYFYTLGDLEEFYDKFNRERHQNSGFAQNLSVLQCLHLAESQNCVRIAAHPFGYFGINRGVLKCVEKNMLPGVLNHIDGIEVICGGMIKNLNLKAIKYAEINRTPFTGGSDAHILSEVGNVVTAVQGDTVEEFLKGILRRENLVIGKPGGYAGKGATAGVIAWSFVPYTASMLNGYYSIQKSRTARFVSDIQKKISCRMREKRESEKSEEWREES